MNFKNFISKVSSSACSATLNVKDYASTVKDYVSDFDFFAATRASINTVKVMPTIISKHAKDAHQHYKDLKAHNASRPKVINVKAERMPEKN